MCLDNFAAATGSRPSRSFSRNVKVSLIIPQTALHIHSAHVLRDLLIVSADKLFLPFDRNDERTQLPIIQSIQRLGGQASLALRGMRSPFSMLTAPCQPQHRSDLLHPCCELPMLSPALPYADTLAQNRHDPATEDERIDSCGGGQGTLNIARPGCSSLIKSTESTATATRLTSVSTASSSFSWRTTPTAARDATTFRCVDRWQDPPKRLFWRRITYPSILHLDDFCAALLRKEERRFGVQSLWVNYDLARVVTSELAAEATGRIGEQLDREPYALAFAQADYLITTRSWPSLIILLKAAPNLHVLRLYLQYPFPFHRIVPFEKVYDAFSNLPNCISCGCTPTPTAHHCLWWQWRQHSYDPGHTFDHWNSVLVISRQRTSFPYRHRLALTRPSLNSKPSGRLCRGRRRFGDGSAAYRPSWSICNRTYWHPSRPPMD